MERTTEGHPTRHLDMHKGGVGFKNSISVDLVPFFSSTRVQQDDLS
jgi:hypothetical protein